MKQVRRRLVSAPDSGAVPDISTNNYVTYTNKNGIRVTVDYGLHFKVSEEDQKWIDAANRETLRQLEAWENEGGDGKTKRGLDNVD